MNRNIAAVVVAPLWVPLAFAVLARWAMFPYPEDRLWVAVAVLLAAVFGYGGAILFGIPAFRRLRPRRGTSCWLAAFLGFAVAVILSSAFYFLFGVLSGFGVGDSLLGALSASTTWASLGATGSLGILVAATLWLIARPDRA